MKRESVVPSRGDDAERAVARTDQLAGCFDDPGKEAVQIRVRLNEQDCVDQGVESLRIGNFVKRHCIRIVPHFQKTTAFGSMRALARDDREGEDHQGSAAVEVRWKSSESTPSGEADVAIPVAVTDQVLSSGSRPSIWTEMTSRRRAANKTEFSRLEMTKWSRFDSSMRAGNRRRETP